MITALVTGGLRFMIGIFFNCMLLSLEKPGKRYICYGFSAFCAVTAVFVLFSGPVVLRLGIEAVIFTVCTCGFQKSDSRMCLYISIFYELAVSFWQFLTAAGFGIIFRSENFLMSESMEGMAAVWIFYLLLAVFAIFLWKRKDLDKAKGFRLAVYIALAGFFAVVTLSEQVILVFPKDTLDMWTIVSVNIMVAILIFKINRQYQMEKEAARLKAEQAELLERDYTSLNRVYAANAKLFHDVHNHIGTLRQLVFHEKYEEALEYLDELFTPVREMTDTVWTGDETVDFLINSKMAEAVSHQVPMKTEVEFPHHMNIKSVDLCAILGNLLDNALDAVSKVDDPKERFIILKIRRIHQMLIIKVENSFSEAPKQENGQLQTIKINNGLHGWGLKSAQTAAEKYDGMVQTTVLGNVFRAVATLSY